MHMGVRAGRPHNSFGGNRQSHLKHTAQTNSFVFLTVIYTWIHWMFSESRSSWSSETLLPCSTRPAGNKNKTSSQLRYEGMLTVKEHSNDCEQYKYAGLKIPIWPTGSYPGRHTTTQIHKCFTCNKIAKAYSLEHTNIPKATSQR
jgi:hypothetical protein